jgi:uncharacterized protein with HEPN domain
MRSDALYLADILDAIEAIERFVTGFDEARFLSDELVQSAVLQKLSTIGEAAARLSDATRDVLPGIPSSVFATSPCMRVSRSIGGSCSSPSSTTSRYSNRVSPDT